jgi:membrane protease YdiL (CAAX protease family)
LEWCEIAPVEPTRYLLRIADGRVFGPSPEPDIVRSIVAGRVAPSSHVSAQPDGAYVPIVQVPAFASAFQQLAAARARSNPAMAVMASPAAPSAVPAPAAPATAAPAAAAAARPRTVEGFLFDDADAGALIHPMARSASTISGAAVPVPGEDAADGANGADGTEAGVSDYLQERGRYDEAKRDLEEGRYLSAKQKFERLIELQPKTSEYLASAAYAEFLLATEDKDRFSLAGRLREIHDGAPYCVTTLTYLARVQLKMGRPKTAVRFFQDALNVEPERRDLQTELQKAQDLVDGKVEGGSSDKLSIAELKATFKERLKDGGKKKAMLDDEPDPKRLFGAVTVMLILGGFLFGLSVVAKMGADEYFYSPSNGFWYIRRAMLLVAGIALSMVVIKDDPVDATDFVAAPQWIVAALAWGGFVGYMSPPQAVKTGMVAVITMTIFHVVAEEVFFRGYLARALARALPGALAPTAFGGLLYGLYHLTFYNFSVRPTAILGAGPARQVAVDLTATAGQALVGTTTMVEAWSWIGMISLGAGIPYFLLYYVSRSFTAPLLCHLTVNLTMMILSFERLGL